VLWRNRISQGITNGGIHWDMTMANNTVFVPILDQEKERNGYLSKSGLFALNVDSGEMIWEQPAERGCKFDFNFNIKPLIGLENARNPKQACKTI
jgi:polyvinyl alcohol dehydrogenase (cytochrome)